MNIIEPKVEYWSELGILPDEHVARCAAVCYKSKQYNTESLIESLIRNNHLSMFRHRTHYYRVSKNSTAGKQILDYLHYCETFGVNLLLAIVVGNKNIYVSANHQYVMEHIAFQKLMKIYEVNLENFAKHTTGKSIIRYTFCIDTSIKVSRELNRVSPNNISEQSTRYVNFISKDGDVTVCRSIDDHLGENKEEIMNILTLECMDYVHLVESGIKPEDARRVLPLDTATRVVYTYTFKEWENILDLRYFEKTGKAAPDCKLIASKIYDVFKSLGYYGQ